jgi:adenine-specific DNA-methyltransferase
VGKAYPSIGGGDKGKKPIEQYAHLEKMRKNNPPAGLVTPETDRDGEKKIYAYDPHLDPLTDMGR